MTTLLSIGMCILFVAGLYFSIITIIDEPPHHKIKDFWFKIGLVIGFIGFAAASIGFFGAIIELIVKGVSL